MPLMMDEEQIQTLESVQQMFEQAEDEFAFAEADRVRKQRELEKGREKRAENQRIRQRNVRIQALRNHSQIQMPTEMIQEHTFGNQYKETKGAAKRKLRSHMLGSRLRTKRQNAEAVEAASNTWEQTIERRKQGLPGPPEGCPPMDYQALSQYLTDDQERNLNLMTGQMKLGDTIGLTMGQVDECTRQFMDLDLQIDLRNDETIAKESVRLEELSKKTEAMRHLLTNYTQLMTVRLSEEQREDLYAKLRFAEQIADCYQMQKKVITNSYYRTHYNSEISYKYHEQDTLEQKNLTMLLWQTEYLKSTEALRGNNEKISFINTFREEIVPEEAAFEEQAKQLIRQTPINLEFQKNDANIEDSRHAAYFRQHNVEKDPLFDRLKDKNYYITGEPIQMEESFARHLSNIPRLKAVQHMDPASLHRMIDDLIRIPVHPRDPEEVEACRQANRNGMLMFKEVLRKQMDYLKRKYGNGFLLLSPQESVDHILDFKSDFTNMQGMYKFIIYLQELGMFDEASEADQELEQWIKYYSNTATADAFARDGYRGTTYQSYAEYKVGLAKNFMMTEANRTSVLKSTDTLHLDVRWDTFFDEQNVVFEEVLNCIKYKPSERMRTDAGTENPTWNQLMPETKEMPRLEAARYFIQKEYEIAKETQEFDNESAGFLQTLQNMLERLSGYQGTSEGAAGDLYRQLSEDLQTIRREQTESR